MSPLGSTLSTELTTYCGQLVSKYSCSLCNRVFTSLTSLKRHSQFYTAPHFSYPCCGQSFLWMKGTVSHSCWRPSEKITENLEGGFEPCDDLRDCGSSDNSCSENVGERMFKCNNCPAKFSRYQTIQSHIIKYPGKHDFMCRQCKKHFFSKEALKKHLCLLAAFSFQCSCKQYFNSLKKFKAHIGQSRPYVCCSCNHKNATFNNLINHIRSHTKENPFSCGICKRKFRVRESLTVHMKLHTGEKQYHCSKCSYATSRKWNLHLHEKRHNPERINDRQYLCAVCGSRFYMRHHLRRHAPIHNENNSHLCLICGKLFSQNAYLEKHLKNHKKDSDIGQKCDICATELQKGQLYQHHIETGHFQHVCHSCRAVFLTKFNLQRHLKNHKNLFKTGS